MPSQASVPPRPWSVYGLQVNRLSLVAETTQTAAIRACPGDVVTAHTPQVFFHAFRTYLKTATTCPTKGRAFSTCMAQVFLPTAPPASRPCLRFFIRQIPIAYHSLPHNPYRLNKDLFHPIHFELRPLGHRPFGNIVLDEKSCYQCFLKGLQKVGRNISWT